MRENRIRSDMPYVPPEELGLRHLYDYHTCKGEDMLKKTLAHINAHGYELVSVCRDGEKFLVFFKAWDIRSGG